MEKLFKMIPREFIRSTVIFIIVDLIFLGVCNIMYNNSALMYYNGMAGVNSAYDIRTYADNIYNEISTNVGRKEEIDEFNNAIENELANMNNAMSRCNQVNVVSMIWPDEAGVLADTDASVRHFIQCTKGSVQLIKNETDKSAALSVEELKEARNAVFENTDHVIEMCQEFTDHEMKGSARFHTISNIMLVIIMIIGSASIIMIGRSAKKREDQVSLAQKEAEYQAQKAQKSSQKTFEIAYKNLIMDCGNRFALQERIKALAEDGYQYYLVRYVMVDFRDIITLAGYGNMDDYLSKVSELIQEKVGDRGEVFTTNGEDFAILFEKDNIDPNALVPLCNEIHAMISNMSAVSNINVRSNVIGVMIDSYKLTNTDPDTALTVINSGFMNVLMSGGTGLVFM